MEQNNNPNTADEMAKLTSLYPADKMSSTRMSHADKKRSVAMGKAIAILDFNDIAVPRQLAGYHVDKPAGWVGV